MTELTHDAWLVDLDGTLYASRPVKLAMAAELALMGWGAVSVLRRFRHEHEVMRETLRDPVSNPFQVQIDRAAAATGKDAAQVEAVVRDWMIERPGRWIHRFRRAGLLEEIAAFRSAGGRTALVSDYPARSKLRALQAADRFDVIVANGEEGGPPRLKPWPDGYQLAAQRLDVEPGRCLVIGDRTDADGDAATAMGADFRLVR